MAELDNGSLIGIVAGAVGGLIVILIIVIVLIYCLCMRKSRKDKSKFNPLASNTVSSQSRLSTLSQGDDPASLPKVSSNGLWLSRTTMQAAEPSHAYYHDKNPGKMREPQKDLSYPLYRATSEPKIIEGQVYQGNLRIYHSQQLGPLYEVYEPGRFDRYNRVQTNPLGQPLWEDNKLYNSRAMLIQESLPRPATYQRGIDDVDDGANVKRSSSDVTDRSSRRPNQNNRYSEPAELKGGRGLPNSDKKFTAFVEVHSHQPIEIPVRSHWGPNRGPNKGPSRERNAGPTRERNAGPTRERNPNKGKSPTSNLTTEIRADIGPPMDNQTSSNNVAGRYESTWEPTSIYQSADNTTTIYSPQDIDSYSRQNNRYPNPQKQELHVELRTSYSTIGSPPNSVDQAVQVDSIGGEITGAASPVDTVSSVQGGIDTLEEDVGYFTSSGRAEPSYKAAYNLSENFQKMENFEVASDITDLESKGKHITAEAFEFLESYLSDDETSTVREGSLRGNPAMVS